MSGKAHQYKTHLKWTGQDKSNFSDRVLDQAFTVEIEGKPMISGSADPKFGGNAAQWNPEDLMLAALSSCHHLWFMFLCSRQKIAVEIYEDEARGTLEMNADGSGQFTEATLFPRVVLSAGCDPEQLAGLHETAHEKCFIAKSVNFPVHIRPSFEVAP